MKQAHPEKMFSAFNLPLEGEKSVKKVIASHESWEKSNDSYRTEINIEKKKIVDCVVNILMNRMAVLSSFWTSAIGQNIAFAVDSAIRIDKDGVTFESTGGHLSIPIENIRLFNATNSEIVKTLNAVLANPDGMPPLAVIHPHPNSDSDDDFSDKMATHATFLLVLTTPQEFVSTED